MPIPPAGDIIAAGVYTMVQEELNGLMARLHHELKSLGIPVAKKLLPGVKVNTRAKRRLGCCYYQAGQYWIEVSESVLENEDLLRQTLIHELLHTCPKCRDHGAQWKAYAQVVNEKLGYQIERTVKTQTPAGPLRHEEVKYILECQSCGAQIKRMRMSKAVKSPWRYRCPCGGKLRRVL